MMTLDKLMEFLVYASAGAVVAIPLLALNIKLAPRFGLIDWPKARGVSDAQIPIVGHSLVLIAIISLFIVNQVFDLPPWYLVTAIGIAVMGHLDDRRPLSAVDKMFFQILTVAVVLSLDPGLRHALGSEFSWKGIFLAFFFVIGMVNSINFVDGIDGLGATVIMIGSLGLCIYSLPFQSHYGYFIVASVIFGALLPFLYLNVWRRAGFLGNVGSYFFAYLLAVTHAALPIPANGPLSKLAISGLCFIIPIADSLTVIVSRLMTIRSPFEADRGHLHHRLIQTSVTLRYVLLNFGVIECWSMVVGVLVAQNAGIRMSSIPVVICVSQIMIATILIILVEKASKRRVQSYFQRLDGGEPIYYLKYQLNHQDGSPVSPRTLQRLEARVFAEIRVTDLCFSESPGTLFVVIRSMTEPITSVSERVEAVFRKEEAISGVVLDQGEFRKMPDTVMIKKRKSA